MVGITPRGFTGTMMVFGPELFFPLGVLHSLATDIEGQDRRTLQRAGAFRVLAPRRPRATTA